MHQVFEGHGIRLEYPEDWVPHEQSAPEEFTLTVNSPATSFWAVTLLFDRPKPERVVDSVLSALREEYSEIDVYDSEDRIGDELTLAHDVDFVCHDLIGSAFLRAIMLPQFTLFVLYQGADFELDEVQPILERITKSLTWVDDDNGDVSEIEDFAEMWSPATEGTPDSDRL